MATHDLKTDPEVFKESLYGKKNFEIRLNDRDFKEGDILNLLETEFSGEEMKEGEPLVYTGRALVRCVSYVLHGHHAGYGLEEDWCVMSVI